MKTCVYLSYDLTEFHITRDVSDKKKIVQKSKPNILYSITFPPKIVTFRR